jgi:hypothetical protein
MNGQEHAQRRFHSATANTPSFAIDWKINAAIGSWEQQRGCLINLGVGVLVFAPPRSAFVYLC